MKKLTIQDFSVEEDYLSYTVDDYEIMIEPCVNGHDVRIFKGPERVEQDYCTDTRKTHRIRGRKPLGDKFRKWSLEEALKKANQYADRHI